MAAKRNSIVPWLAATSIFGWLLFAPAPAFPQEEIQTLKHPAWVGSIFLEIATADVYTACADGVVRKWSATTGKESKVLKSNGEIASSVSLLFVPHPTYRYLLAAGSYDGAIRVGRETDKKWEEVRTRATHRGAVLALASDHKWRLASGGMDGTIKISGFERVGEMQTLRGHKSWVNSLDFSYFGSKLASGSSDGTVRIWSIDTQRRESASDLIETSKSEVRSVKFSRTETILAVGLRYGEVQLWNAQSLKQLKAFKAHEGDCWAVAFSPDGKTLITGGGDWGKPGEVKFWDVETGDLKATLKHSGEVLCLAVAPDGRRLAAGGGDGNVKVWNTEKLIGVPKAE